MTLATTYVNAQDANSKPKAATCCKSGGKACCKSGDKASMGKCCKKGAATASTKKKAGVASVKN